MPKRFSLAFPVILSILLLSIPAYPQKTEQLIQLLNADVLKLQRQVEDLQKDLNAMKTRNDNLQTLIEGVTDKVNLMGPQIQGVQTSVQSSVATNAQTTQASIDRLNKAIEEVKAQNVQIEKNSQANSQALAASISSLNTNLERIATDLTGRIDRVNANTDRIGAQLTTNIDKLADENRKLNANTNKEMKQGLGEIQLQLTALTDMVSKLLAPTTETITPEKLIITAQQNANAGIDDIATEEFQEVIKKWPDHSLAPRAHFGLAEILFNQEDWEQAKLSYEIAFQKSKDPRIKRTALYKQGLCQEKLKQTEEAKATFNRVRIEFSGSDEATLAEKRLPPPAPATPPRGGAAAPANRG